MPLLTHALSLSVPQSASAYTGTLTLSLSMSQSASAYTVTLSHSLPLLTQAHSPYHSLPLRTQKARTHSLPQGRALLLSQHQPSSSLSLFSADRRRAPPRSLSRERQRARATAAPRAASIPAKKEAMMIAASRPSPPFQPTLLFCVVGSEEGDALLAGGVSVCLRVRACARARVRA